MKFGQLREYNRNIYLEKLCTKCAEEASSKLFHKKIKNEYISGSTVWNVIIFFYCLSKSRSTKIYQN